MNITPSPSTSHQSIFHKQKRNPSHYLVHLRVLTQLVRILCQPEDKPLQLWTHRTAFVFFSIQEQSIEDSQNYFANVAGLQIRGKSMNSEKECHLILEVAYMFEKLHSGYRDSFTQLCLKYVEAQAV